MASNDRLLSIATTVKGLTYAIGLLGFLSVVPHINAIYTTIFLIACLVSLSFEYRGAYLPRWLLNVLSLAFIAITVMRMNIDNFVALSVEALLVLLAIKFLEKKRFRDHLQIYILSLFLLAGSALFSTNIIFLIYLVGLLVLLPAAVVLLAYESEEHDMKLPVRTVLNIIRKSLLISLLSVPVAIVIFVILPRTSYPLFNLLQRSSGAATGFSDGIQLGEVSSVQEDATAILRVKMEQIDEDQLYWRGVVLDYFNGTSWKRSPEQSAAGRVALSVSGRPVEQTIYLEPYGYRYLFALDRPASLSLPQIVRYHDLTYAQRENSTKRLRYTAVSFLSAVLPEASVDKRMYLQLPGDGLGRIRELVRNIAQGNDKVKTVQLLLTYLKKGDYKYTLENLPVSKSPLEDFLLSNKQGNCEYFASAMAVMLRVADIPSRVVGGYRGGDYNEIGGYYLVAQKNAHVWVEVYLEGRGWIRIDPTPARAGSYAAYSQERLFRKMRLFFDTVNYYWNASVINYDFYGQVALLRKLESSMTRPKIDFSSIKKEFLGYILVLTVLATGALLAYRLTITSKTEEERLRQLFLKKMEKLGYTKAASEGLEEFVAKVEDAETMERAYRFVREFESYYYQDKKLAPKEASRLKGLVKEI
ncbi:MAG: transglutaminaseTgpA domain-containing protein [Nitrospirota bacterium]